MVPMMYAQPDNNQTGWSMELALSQIYVPNAEVLENRAAALCGGESIVELIGHPGSGNVVMTKRYPIFF
jgi:hypothetical protein